MELIFTVNKVFHIEGRGISVVGQFDKSEIKFYIGDKVQIKRQDGSKISSTIKGIPIKSFPNQNFEIVLGNALSSSDVAEGNELWLI